MSRTSDSRLNQIALVSALFATTVSIASLVFIGGSSSSRDVLLGGTISVAAAALLAAVTNFQLLSKRHFDLRIAVAGPPGVGKTVYINILFRRLMDGSADFAFTAETQTAQHVYEALRLDRWGGLALPKSSTDSVTRFRGTVESARRRSVLFRRQTLALEVGDSAGELWLDLVSERFESDTPVFNSTFFQYVAESDAIIYLVDCTSLVGSSDYVFRQAEQLAATIQLLRSIRSSRPGSKLDQPLCLVFSKADVLTPDEITILADAVGDSRIAETSLLIESVGNTRSASSVNEEAQRSRRKNLSRSIGAVQELLGVLERGVEDFQVFILSSLGSRVSNSDDRPGFPAMISAVRPILIDRPLVWIIDQVEGATHRR